MGNKQNEKPAGNALNLISVSGGRVCHVPVVFSDDSKYYFASVSSTIQVYSMESGEIVRSMSVYEEGKESSIVSICLNPALKYQIYSACADGTICLWDYSDGSKLKAWNVGFEVVRMILAVISQESFLLEIKKRESQHSLCLVDLTGDEASLETIVELDRKISCFDVSNEGMLAYALDKKLQWINLHDANKLTTSCVHERPINTMSFHPKRPGMLATGDARGQILLWHLVEGKSKSSYQKMHWHAHKVLSLEFSPDGEYLYSGGQEAVLVIWQLGSGEKQFLPRLGSPIIHIKASKDHQYVSLSGSDNSVKIVSTFDLSLKRRLLGLKFSESIKEYRHKPIESRTGGIVFHPPTGFVVLKSTPGAIQVWDYKNGKNVLEMDISERPRVYLNDTGLVLPTSVQHVAFSPNGEWLATVDARGDDPDNDNLDANLRIMQELQLKFWKYDDNGKSYKLARIIEKPHKCKITRIEFSSDIKNPLLATSSLDKTFRVWQLKKESAPIRIHGKDTDQMRLTYNWNLKATGFWKDEQVYDISFSEDNSILAAAFGETITLWNPYSMTLLKTFYKAGSTLPVEFLSFCKINKESSISPYLVSTTRNSLTVWNVLESKAVVNFELMPTFIDVSSKSHSLVFGYLKDSKSFVVHLDLDASGKSKVLYVDQNIRAGCIAPSSEGLELICFNNDYDLCVFSSSQETVRPDISPAAIEPEKSTNVLAAMFSTRNSSAHEETEEIAGVTRSLDGLKLLENPTHLLQRPTQIFAEFMDSMLLKSHTVAAGPNKDEVKRDVQEDLIILENQVSSSHEWAGIVPSQVIDFITNDALA